MSNTNKTPLDTVLEKIEYNFTKDLLVKPLPPVKVMKHITEMVHTEPKEIDPATGLYKTEIKEYDKEVDSSFRTGVIIALPTNGSAENLELGQTIVFPYKFSIDFDLFKDSVLVKPHDVIGIIKQ